MEILKGEIISILYSFITGACRRVLHETQIAQKGAKMLNHVRLLAHAVVVLVLSVGAFSINFWVGIATVAILLVTGFLSGIPVVWVSGNSVGKIKYFTPYYRKARPGYPGHAIFPPRPAPPTSNG